MVSPREGQLVKGGAVPSVSRSDPAEPETGIACELASDFFLPASLLGGKPKMEKKDQKWGNSMEIPTIRMMVGLVHWKQCIFGA
jgi:hypothetical protein